MTIKSLSRKAVLDSSKKFQLTASTKSFDSVLWHLQALQCGLVCLHLVLLPRRGGGGGGGGGATGISRKQDTSVAC